MLYSNFRREQMKTEGTSKAAQVDPFRAAREGEGQDAGPRVDDDARQR
jgi:hypothetical protein